MSMADTAERPGASVPIVSSLSELLGVEKKQYLVGQEMDGGTAAGFRRRIADHYTADRKIITDRLLIAVMGMRLDALNEDERRVVIEDAINSAHAPTKFGALHFDALMEASTKKWQQQPRKRGPDLFSINGLVIADHLTRVRIGIAIGDSMSGDDEHEEEGFEKVDSNFANVRDLQSHALIHMRKAAQASTSAEIEMKAVDEARRRAKGDDSVLLRDLADKRK